MRILLLVALACFAFPSVLYAATVTWNANQVFGPRTQMIGHWTFNGPDVDWTTGVARDRSGWGNHASMIGLSTTTSPVAGKLGQGVRLDGLNDHVFSPINGTTFTQFAVSFWTHSGVNPSVQTGIFQWAESISSSFPFILFTKQSDGYSKLYVDGDYRILTRLPASWSHVVIVLDQSNMWRLYVNGASVGTYQDDASHILQNNAIGVYLGNGYQGYFPGDLDDVRIYSRAITPAEISLLYRSGRVTVNVAPKPATATKGNLVGHWTFDGPDVNWTTGTVLDKSGQGNHGSMSGLSTTSSPVAGKLGQGMRFTMTGNNHVRVGRTASIDNIDRITVSTWIYPKTSGGNVGTVVRKGVNDTTLSWRLAFHSGLSRALMFSHSFSGANGYWNTGQLAMNEWYHVAVTYDRTSPANDPIFYINGVATTTTEYGTPSGTPDSDASYDLTIGAKEDGDALFDGAIDDVRIYNRILTPTEIATLYKGGSVTIVASPFSACPKTVADADGNVYNTVKIGTQCWMKQNLRVGTMVTAATTQTNNSTIEKWCYNDTLANCMTTNNPNHPDGGLYQWNEAMQYSTTAGAQGICPAGWHIPTHDELTTLERAVCTSGTCATDFPYDTTTTGYRGTNEGTKLKPNGTSGFEFNLAGIGVAGSFFNRSASGGLWSSSESGVNAWGRGVLSGSAQVLRGAYSESSGLSVRCVQD